MFNIKRFHIFFSIKISFYIVVSAKVPGNFHVSTHSSQVQPDDPDISHEIIDLYFGSKITSAKGLPHTVGLKQFNALRGFKTGANVQKGSSFDYTLRIVPTVIQEAS